MLLVTLFSLSVAILACARSDDAESAYKRGDYALAYKGFKTLAEQGNAVAQNSLGGMYTKGQGVLQDYAEAMEWYRKAAEQGNADAQNSLGEIYAKGQGVPQDFVQAHMWFNLAAAQGHSTAQGNRDEVTRKMTPSQIAEAQSLARQWKPKGKD